MMVLKTGWFFDKWKIKASDKNLPYTSCWANIFGLNPPDEIEDARRMRLLATGRFGYTFAYVPGAAIGSPAATDGIHVTPTNAMVAGLFPMIDNAKASQTILTLNTLVVSISTIDAYIDECAFAFAYMGVL
jgi:hypothetical protein